MKKLLATACLFLAFAPAAFSIEPSQWQYCQFFDIEQAGPVCIPVPFFIVGDSRPDLRDLRIIGPDLDKTELPYVILDVPTERPPYKISGVTLTPRAFSATMDGDKTIVLIDSGTNKPINSIQLSIADIADYTKPARVEVSDDGKNWTLVAQGVPLFRRGGAFVQNTIPMDLRTERHIRVTISNQGINESPIAIRGAYILTGADEIAARAGIPDEETPVTIPQIYSVKRNMKRDTGTTILTLDLGAANVSLTQLHLDIADTLFMRRVTVLTAPLEPGGDQTMLATGPGSSSIYRIKDVDGTPMATNTTLEFGGRPVPTRRIEVRIDDGDSPPLRILGASAKRRPVLVAFNPPVAGCYTFLTGNPQAAAPRYDLAAFSQNLGRLPVTQIKESPIGPNPDYRAPKPPGEPLNLATRALFWVALAVVVILLLVVVAKLLPKPKE